MKRLLNYTIILSLSLVVFGCGGPTIDYESDEFRKNFTGTKDELLYKGDPYNGTLVMYSNKWGGLKQKNTFKDGKQQDEERYDSEGQLRLKKTLKINGTEDSFERYDKEGKVTYKRKDGIEVK